MNLRGIAAILGLVALVGVVVILFDRHWQISVPYTGVVKGYQFLNNNIVKEFFISVIQSLYPSYELVLIRYELLSYSYSKLIMISGNLNRWKYSYHRISCRALASLSKG